ncbi:hypothetical protein ABZ642_32635 [Streptomyces sp. NPDC007157]|uniref:hypothetical protein n=1 Tax=Streptomyces sp. NPDC007157 TaxID=3154681 RepID=UPI0033CB51BB
MPRTTPPRPLDIEAEFPELAGHRKTGYDADFAVAPGWKVGGFARWGVTGPQELVCSCGSPMELLLAIGSAEWEGVRGSWTPLGEATSAGAEGAAARTPTRVVVGRGGSLLVFVCLGDPAHGHRVSLQ